MVPTGEGGARGREWLSELYSPGPAWQQVCGVRNQARLLEEAKPHALWKPEDACSCHDASGAVLQCE